MNEVDGFTKPATRSNKHLYLTINESVDMYAMKAF